MWYLVACMANAALACGQGVGTVYAFREDEEAWHVVIYDTWDNIVADFSLTLAEFYIKDEEMGV